MSCLLERNHLEVHCGRRQVENKSEGFGTLTHPLYELRSVTTTGISAPPIDDVMCKPRAPLEITPVVKAKEARVGSEDTQKAGRKMLKRQRGNERRHIELRESQGNNI